MTEGSGEANSRDVTNASIRRTIAWRLGLVGLAVGLIDIAIMFVLERGRVSELVLERATSDARAFDILTTGDLEAHPQQARQAIAAALDRFMAHARVDRLGECKYVDFRSPWGETITRWYARDVETSGPIGEAARGLDRLLNKE